MDVTDETLARHSAMELQKSLERVQNFSKVVIVNYKNGNFIFTSEIYNIFHDLERMKYEKFDRVNFQDFILGNP